MFGVWTTWIDQNLGCELSTFALGCNFYKLPSLYGRAQTYLWIDDSRALRLTVDEKSRRPKCLFFVRNATVSVETAEGKVMNELSLSNGVVIEFVLSQDPSDGFHGV